MIAMDLSTEAVKVGDHEARLRGLHDKVMFLQGDLSSHPDVENIFQIARKKNNNDALVHYSRFVLHSLDEAEEDKFLLALSKCMKQNEHIFFEIQSQGKTSIEKNTIRIIFDVISIRRYFNANS